MISYQEPLQANGSTEGSVLLGEIPSSEWTRWQFGRRSRLNALDRKGFCLRGGQQEFDFNGGAPEFFGALSSAPFSPTKPWNGHLTRRQRVLLHMEPILRLYRQPGTRDDRHLQYDTLALVMKIFDTIIDQGGFGSEVTEESVLDAVEPLLVAWDEAREVAPSPDLHNEVVHRILAELKNDAQRQQPFEAPYHAFDNAGNPKQRVLRFKLLIEEFGYGGGIVLKLSSEAINLFLNAFGLDIEDAQVANEAVVQSQLERGRFNEAVDSAQNARGQSMRLEAKIRWILLQITRDIDRVDWRSEADELLREALDHVGRRLRVEDNILQSAQDKLDNLVETDSRRPALAEVARLMKECRGRHLQLHGQLMPARGEYLRQQARQAFVAARLRGSTDLRDSVLRDVLAQPVDVASEALSAAGVFMGPQAPSLLNLRELVHWQLQPKRQTGRGLDPVEEIELDHDEGDERRYDDGMIAEAADVLASLRDRTRLSKLIGDGEARAREEETLDALVLQVVRAFGDEANSMSYQVELAERSGLNGRRHQGDDLWVIPGNGEALDDGPS